MLCLLEFEVLMVEFVVFSLLSGKVEWYWVGFLELLVECVGLGF